MFSDAEFEVVGFSSMTKSRSDDTVSKRKVQESSSQTEIKSFEAGTQTSSHKDLGLLICNSKMAVPSKNFPISRVEEVQLYNQDALSLAGGELTRRSPHYHSPAPFLIQTEEIVKNMNDGYNVDNLAAFLKRISPDVLLELNKAEKSKAFTLYHDVSDEQQFHNTIKATHIIQSAEVPTIPQVKVSSLAWSCTGNVISFGYETFQHMDWCTHNSSVHFYNIKMSDFDEKNPRHSIPTSSCVTSLATHPFEPAIIAIGTADGDVHIWDLKKADHDVNIGNVINHKDRITSLSWETINSQLYLVTSSLDGYLFFFKVVPSIGSVVISDRYLMTNEATGIIPGITTFGFSSQPGVFVVALESGELLHCSTFSAPTIPSTSVKNPVLKSIVKKTALVTDLKFSPFIEHLFIICCVDKTFFLYSLKESAHLYKTNLDFLALGIAWSRNQGNVFFLWGESQKVHVFNSDNGKTIAELQSDISNYDTINSVAVSPKSSRLALSIGNGSVLIWEIPEIFKT